MKQIGDFILNTVPPKTKINSKRAYTISLFVDELNRERRLKPFAPSFIAFKLSHLSIPDLEYLYSICKDYKLRGNPFGKCFWGSLKTSNKSNFPKTKTNKQVD